ncbi:MAG: 30S ribosomal protein S16 [Patescibacteria group bacterium]|jgi:small subunit ribosomal protein S16
MLSIRLRRTGKKKKPSYRIVVTDNRAPIYGKYLEMIGHYDPFTKVVVLDKEKALEWMNKGAKPSDTVGKILEAQGVKHKSIVIKKFRAVSKKELEVQKAQDEAEKEKERQEKEAAKEAFEQQVEAEKAEQPSSEEKLQEAAEESIKEIKEEESTKPEEKPEKAEPEDKE